MIQLTLADMTFIRRQLTKVAVGPADVEELWDLLQRLDGLIQGERQHGQVAKIH